MCEIVRVATMRRTIFGRLAMLVAASMVAVSCGGSSPTNADHASAIVVASGVSLLTAPRIAGVGADTWVAWVEQGATGPRTVAARVGAAGSTQLTALTTTAAAAGPVQLADAGGTPVAAWIEESGTSHRLVVAAWDGQRWVRDPSITASPNSDVQLVVGPAGQLALAWHEFIDPAGSRLRVAVRDAAGVWGASHAVRVIAGTLPGLVRMAFDEAGELLVGWLEYVNNGSSTADPDFALWSAMKPGGGAWSAATRIEPEKVRDFRIASAAAQSWVVAWNAGGLLEPRRLYSRRLIGGAWDAVAERLDTVDAESARDIELQGSGGLVQAAWIASTDSTGEFTVRVARMNLVDGRWLTPTLLLQSTVVQAAAMRLIQRSDGRAALTWNYATGDHLPWVAISPIPGVWDSASHLDAEAFNAQGADLTAWQDGWAAAWYRWRGATFDVAMRRLR